MVTQAPATGTYLWLMKNSLLSNQLLRTAALLSVTLGLAPFFPEPHIFGKLRWIWGGGEGMQPMDYFDLILHGAPWALLIMVLVTRLVIMARKLARG